MFQNGTEYGKILQEVRIMWYYYVGGVVVVLAITLITVFIIKSKTPKKSLLDIEQFVNILVLENIKSIDFKRNKIVVTFKDIELFDPEQLQQAGAKGISIIGDVIKFYIDGDEEENYQLFRQLDNHIKGK